jgi:hypothetical protein
MMEWKMAVIQWKMVEMNTQLMDFELVKGVNKWAHPMETGLQLVPEGLWTFEGKKLGV